MSLPLATEAEIWRWYLARRALGTFKTKARELKLTPTQISECIYKYRCMHGEYTRKRGRK